MQQAAGMEPAGNTMKAEIYSMKLRAAAASRTAWHIPIMKTAGCSTRTATNMDA